MGLRKQYGVQFFVNSKNWVLPKNITPYAPVNIKHVNIVRRMKAPTSKIKKYELFLILNNGEVTNFQGSINCNIVYTDLNSTTSNIDISWEGRILQKSKVVGVLIYDHIGRIFANLKVTNSITHKVGGVFRIRYQIEFNRRAYHATS